MLNLPALEKKVLKFWQKEKIFEKLRKKNQAKKPWSFLDGPITANNPMGVHHAWGRTYKDLFQRYQAMRGFDQRFQNGFDCQGLWVEVEVEKELGFKNKKDIEQFGIKRFVQKCRQRVLKYSKIQTGQSIRLGQWMDWPNSYYTMSDENNYAIWYFLKKCHQKGLLYKGRDVVPWCPRCGTAISQHEILTEEYKEIVHKAIFFKLPIKRERRTFFLVWTTTPWTLPANVALAVHPDLIYAKVQDKTGDIFILLRDKVDLIVGGKILETFKGKKLEGLEYQGLFDELPLNKKSLANYTSGDNFSLHSNYKHRIVLWDEVTAEEGTGIVHIAPGCGQEDFQLSKELNIPVIDPSDDESRYKKGFGDLTARFVFEEKTRDLIFKNLENKGLVFEVEDYKHRYPTCWRCKTELIFRLVDEWYIAMDPLRKPLIKLARKIKWIPSFGLGQELDWLKNMKDWLISKKRYWGLALPIYECQKCGHFEVIGSKKELKEKVAEGWKEFEGHSPHRPWIDKVKIKCPKCDRVISRISDVGNPWLDAGIVPFSTMKYFSGKKFWKRWFPADFICESFPGQFKNWFYSLLVMSQVLEGTNPFKTIFGYATLVDEKGEEMHKSKGNVIWFDEAVEKIGADVMRWMYARQNPVNNMRFGYSIAKKIREVLLTFWNSYQFSETYKAIKSRHRQTKNLLDQWIISKFNLLVKEVTERLNGYLLHQAAWLIEDFIDDLSNWYIRRSRKQFHAQTLRQVLIQLCQIMAPFTPFLAEHIYKDLSGQESVHLSRWPRSGKVNQKLIKEMEMTREIVALALAQRAKAKIKVRQPLQNLTINKKLNKELIDLIKDEVNVKEVKFGKDVELDTKITPALKQEGFERELIRQIQELRKQAGFKVDDKIVLFYDGPKFSNWVPKEVLAEKVIKGGKKEIKIDNKKIWLDIKRPKG